MPFMAFVHLRTHTEFSVVDGMLRIDDMAAMAAQDGQGALAITDLANVFGAVKFYNAARRKGVKPIIGADVWLASDLAGSDKPPSRLLLLAQSAEGWRNLCLLLSAAWLTNVQKNLALVSWDVLEAHALGLIALSGADQGAVGQALLTGDAMRAEALAQRLAALFPGRFYIEVQRGGLPPHEAHLRAAVPLAARLGLPVVATHPVQFAEAADYEAHEARICIADGQTLADPKRVKRFSPEQHFKTQAQMEALFADLPSAVANTVQIAQRCNLKLVLGKPQLPDFPTPVEGGAPMPMEAYFRQLAREGLAERLLQLFPDEKQREAERARYEERLAFETDTILKMGFPGYFLIVADFINWAKNNGCPVGPGRGSGAGSLVAYALKITDLDPLRYKLLFERFLNPERVSMPDFDIDFCQANRDRVIDYVKAKYGRDAVSQIVTFGTMAAKAALRDVGRVLGMGYGHVDSVAKLVPAPPGKTVTLRRPPEETDNKSDNSVIYARREAPELEERERKEEEVAELLALAERVEGLVRNVGMHAGGVLIAPGRITDFCPLYLQPGSDSAVSQFDKDDVEAIGLVKFDFLGLATLTILELAQEFLRQRHPQRANFRFEDLPLDDPKVYKLFSDGLVESVFQFESSGMQRMLKDARPSRFEDLIALNAMYRPGPMENIPTFTARKHGREEVEYPHPLLETVLGETYGVMVYQEQVMQAAQVLGGYSLGGADLLRRAMGKKKPEEMAQQRQIFRTGAAAKNIPQPVADEVFDLMEKFAGYGFNKSHAAAYSLLAYHTAWLKVHHPAEFFAANMTIELDDSDKLRVLVRDAKQFGIAFDRPDVNTGTWRFEPVADDRVRYGLGAIKGTGQSAIEAIVAAREEGGPFKSLFDFCARVDRTRINKRSVEALVKAGAFDGLHPERSVMVASIPLAFDYAETLEANAHQGGLFDMGDSHAASTQEPDLVAAFPWSIKERLTFEKTALGFFLSGHLFDQSADEVRRIVRRPHADLIESRDLQLVAGIVSDLRVVNSQRGRVAIFRLDDKTEAVEVVAGEELYNAQRDRLKDDELVILQVKVRADRFSGGLRLDAVAAWDLAGARCRFGKFLRVELNGAVPPVAEVLRDFPSRRVVVDEGELTQGLPVRLGLHRSGAYGELDLGDEARFWPCDEAIARWQASALKGRAFVVYDESRPSGDS
jgi:DNA polymerase-3 subunit alpha